MKESRTLNVDIVSDVVCPWCVIGYGRFKKALSKLSCQIDVNVRWHPFELNPNMASDGENLRQHLSAKYGTTLEGSIKARAMLTDLGKDVGFDFNYFDDMKMFNTHECHQLLLWSAETDKQTSLAMAMFEEFFTGKGNFSHESLLKLVDNIGLDVEEAKQVLLNKTFSLKVRSIENKWAQKGLNGVPAFIFNDSVIVSGAQEVEVFESVMSEVLSEDSI